MRMMGWYELKKVFSSFGSKVCMIIYACIIFLSCWLSSTGRLNLGVVWINEQGENEYGISAVKKIHNAQNEWEGWLTEEKLNAVLKENRRINLTPQAQSDVKQQQNIAYGWTQGFAPIKMLMGSFCTDDFQKYDYYIADELTEIDEKSFYNNRINNLRKWLNDESGRAYSKFSEQEKAYFIHQFEELGTPFYFEYHEGWYQLLDNANYISLLVTLICGFLISGIFSNEFKWRSDVIYFSSELGKDKCTVAKIKAGILIVSVLYWGAMLFYCLFTLCYLGFGGAKCVIQWELWNSIYNLKMWQACGVTLVCGYIGNLFLVTLSMYISAKTRSTTFAVTVPYILVFLPSFLEGIVGWLDNILLLKPGRLLEAYQCLRSFDVLTIYDRVFRALDVSAPLYLLLSVLLLPKIYREYRNKQIA